MNRVVSVKNNTLTGLTVAGKTILSGSYYTLTPNNITTWQADPEIFALVANGDLLVNDGTNDITDSIKGWGWLIGDYMPKSDLGNKIAVHPSSKPAEPGKEFYLQWTAAGDDATNNLINEGPIQVYQMTTGVPFVTQEIKFDPSYGKVYLHEGYASWENAGTAGNYLVAAIEASPTLVQTVSNLDCVLNGNYVKPAPGGPGTGTHGFASTPSLIPRFFTLDGDWDYNGVSLTPNLAGNGEYQMATVDKIVHRYINKMPMIGSSAGYSILTSDETAYLPPNCHIRLTVHNISDTNWTAAFMFEVYREKTTS